MLKTYEENPGCTFEHSMFTHKSLSKKDILRGLRKKDKKCHVKSYFESLKIFFFTQPIKKRHFFAKLSVCT
jgi:hypothetical protein